MAKALILTGVCALLPFIIAIITILKAEPQWALVDKNDRSKGIDNKKMLAVAGAFGVVGLAIGIWSSKKAFNL